MTILMLAKPAVLRLRQILAVLLTATIGAGLLGGQTPAQSPAAAEWAGFLSWHTGRSIIPEDSTMGPLANLRQPDPAWGSALELSDKALAALGRGEVPTELLHPSVRTLLKLEMADALAGTPPPWSARYGLPLRDGSRLSVPVRLSSEGIVNYGYIYLIYDGQWFIEQWAVEIVVASETDS